MQQIRSNIRILFLLILLAGSSQCFAQISAIPTRFVFKIDRPATNELTLMNRSTQPARAEIEIASATGQLEEHYLGKWVVVYPPVISIPPQQRRTVRFSVRPPADLKDGEYRAMLLVKNMPQTIKTNKSDAEPDSVSVGIPFSLTLGISLYGQLGKLEHKGHVDKVTIAKNSDSLVVSGVFINQGNAHLKMSVQASLYNTQGNKLNEHTSQLVVQRASEKAFEHKIELAAAMESGEIEIIFIHEDKVIDQKRTKF
jgi:P pilus assembly chaperone PapD